jgi:hypothetical protein
MYWSKNKSGFFLVLVTKLIQIIIKVSLELFFLNVFGNDLALPNMTYIFYYYGSTTLKPMFYQSLLAVLHEKNKYKL